MLSSLRVVGVLAVAVVFGGACGRSGLLEVEEQAGPIDLSGDLSGRVDLSVPIDFSVPIDLARFDLTGRDLSPPPRDFSVPRDLTPPPRDLSGVDLAGADLAPPPVDLSTVDLLVACPGPCDDNNPCTVDSCDNTTGRCRFVPGNNGASCNDGDFCTTGDSCMNGRCVGGPPPSCDDGNSCTTDSCSRAQQACVHQTRPTGATCDDGDRCTLGDRCIQGVCRGLPRICNDGNVCTTDRCEPSTGACVFTPANGALCNDNNPCTSNDVCTMGRCVGAPVADGLQCVLPFTTGCCAAGQCRPNGC